MMFYWLMGKLMGELCLTDKNVQTVRKNLRCLCCVIKKGEDDRVEQAFGIDSNGDKTAKVGLERHNGKPVVE